MTTGHDITTRIINIVLAEQIDISPMHEKIVVDINSGGEFVFHEYNRTQNLKSWTKSIEKLRNYINKNYMFLELKEPQIEDIFRYLCTEDDWKVAIDNKDSVVGYNIVKELIAEIEKITKCPGLFDKILNEKKNQIYNK